LAYDLDRKAAPQFSEFMAKVFKGSRPMVEFMQQLIGYCLTGFTGEQGFFLFCGPSETSKSTFVKLVRGIMGEYAVVLPSKALLAKPAGAKDYDTALLAGCRLATAIETAAGRRLDEAAIKSITGQDVQRGERKYEHSFEFTSKAKLILATNFRPVIRETDDSIWRRIRPIPFEVKVAPEEIIDSFEEKLIAAEGPGILRFFVEGAMAWYKNEQKLAYPDEVITAQKQYREEQDEVLDFIEERCEKADDDVLTPKDEMYRQYQAHAADGGTPPMSKKRFSLELIRLGYKSKDTPKRHWRGIQFNAEVRRKILEAKEKAERENAAEEAF
jgi:putative DNA primase/helicase